MEVLNKLQMNFHPRDAENLSLVTASNVKLDNDGSCITNEESIRENAFISDFLNSYYGNSDFITVGIIPCNIELVIIAISSADSDNAQIFRYREKTATSEEAMKCVYGDAEDVYFKYHGGKIKGTFTYNVENSLILAVAEYDADEDVPLRVINCGNFDDESVYSDLNLSDSKLAIVPEINFPTLNSHDYIDGRCYKGWWHLFFRYKISEDNYTQWNSFGYPIFVDSVNPTAIIKYCFGNNFAKKGRWAASLPLYEVIGRYRARNGFVVGCSDSFSDDTDIANITFSINVKSGQEFDKIQFGFVCATKDSTRAFRSNDVDVDEYIDYVVNVSNLIEYSATDLITNYTNYFNVKNIVNYKNRLYISNYDETNINVKTINEEDIQANYVDNIKVSLNVSEVDLYDLRYNIPLLSVTYRMLYKNELEEEFLGGQDNYWENEEDLLSVANPNQYDCIFEYAISLVDYLNVSVDTQITVSNGTDTWSAKAQLFWIVPVSDTVPSFCAIGYGTVGSLVTDKMSNSDDQVVVITIDYGTYTSEIQFDTDKNVIVLSNEHINAKNSFYNRCKYSTLIPGEIYNFFIHFVDKYGNATNGYQIPNNSKFIYNGNEVIPVPFTYMDTLYYAIVSVDSNVTDGTDLSDCLTIAKEITDNGDGTYGFSNIANTATYRNAFYTYYDNFNSDKYKGMKWYQIAPYINDECFGIFINSNEDRLFKVPELEQHVRGGQSITKGIQYTYKLIQPKFENITIPNGYVGYFISYEQFEPIKRATGLLTRADSMLDGQYTDSDGNVIRKAGANYVKSSNMLFFSDVFDIADELKIDYSILQIEAYYEENREDSKDRSNLFNGRDIAEYDKYMRTDAVIYPYDFNKPQICSNSGQNDIRRYAMPEYVLGVADSAEDNRVGKSTAIVMDDSYGLFGSGSPDDYKIKMYRATLLNPNINIYTNNEKTLIRLTDVIYNTNSNTVANGLNGVLTYNNFMVYNDDGVSFDDSTKEAINIRTNMSYYPFIEDNEVGEVDSNHVGYGAINIPFVGYIQLPIIDYYYHEAKSFNNEPEVVMYPITQAYDDNSFENPLTYTGIGAGCFVTTANSTDLFVNKKESLFNFNPKTYVNYRDDYISISRYDKTVRRSDVIQDESREIAWRKFSLDAYKNITENKGNITNIVGVGTLFLVHTEHSLFMFDIDNALQTNDKSVQLEQLDVFDVAYKEVFTSALGFGGLQDDLAYSLDQFGYIFYNNDFHRFYSFDNGQLAVIDEDIIQWLNRYTPYNVRFANDKFNNRLIIKMNYKVNGVEKIAVMSYNYNGKHFVSCHDYYFDEAINTKSKLYLKCNGENHTGCSLHQFVQDGSSYGSFDNIKDRPAEIVTCPSRIGIIVNEQYDDIKFLDNISYKLNKLANPTEFDYTNIPVEGGITPYSADLLKVYNNQVNTGELDILIDSEEAKNIFCNYEKPYWELGNWNFSYLRNNIANRENYGDAFVMSRLFGNYFIIEFTFSNSDNLKIEFEELKYDIVK